jgi:hypothetical protein
VFYYFLRQEQDILLDTVGTTLYLAQYRRYYSLSCSAPSVLQFILLSMVGTTVYLAQHGRYYSLSCSARSVLQFILLTTVGTTVYLAQHGRYYSLSCSAPSVLQFILLSTFGTAVYLGLIKAAAIEMMKNETEGEVQMAGDFFQTDIPNFLVLRHPCSLH